MIVAINCLRYQDCITCSTILTLLRYLPAHLPSTNRQSPHSGLLLSPPAEFPSLSVTPALLDVVNHQEQHVRQQYLEICNVFRILIRNVAMQLTHTSRHARDRHGTLPHTTTTTQCKLQNVLFCMCAH